MFRQYAKRYIGLGFPVIPVMSNKVPAIPSWAPYQERMPSDAEIEEWSRDLGGMNIGVVTGKLSNLTVVDADTPEAIKLIESLLPEQYEVPTVQTPRGGRHYYFQHAPQLRSKNGTLPHVDVKSEGGFILLPPSKTIATSDGKCATGQYSWLVKKMHRVPIPELLLERLIEGQKNGRPVAQGETPAPILNQGTRDQDLFHTAFYMLKDGRPLDEVRRIVLDMAKVCNPPFPEREALAKIESAYKRIQGKPGAISFDADADAVPDYHPLSKIKCRETYYLMQDRIPLAMLSLLVGDGGIGKSTLLTEIACRISKGEPLPGSHKALVKGTTIYITSENQPEEVLKPRVLACGGDTNKIIYLRNVLVPTSDKPDEPRVFDVSKHMPGLRRLIVQIGDVQLVVIDPIISHISERLDPNSTVLVRHVMDILSDFTRETQIALVVVAHMAKGQAVSAIYRVAGSHQWVAAARVVLAIMKDKEDTDPDRRLLCPLKSNIYISPRSLAFKIVPAYVQPEELPGANLKTAKVEFEPEELDIDVEALFAPIISPQSSTTSNAIRFLNETLKNGGVKQEEIEALAEKAGIKDRTLRVARQKLQIYPERVGFGPGGHWVLWLPDLWDAYKRGK